MLINTSHFVFILLCLQIFEEFRNPEPVAPEDSSNDEALLLPLKVTGRGREILGVDGNSIDPTEEVSQMAAESDSLTLDQWVERLRVLSNRQLAMGNQGWLPGLMHALKLGTQARSGKEVAKDLYNQEQARSKREAEVAFLFFVYLLYCNSSLLDISLHHDSPL